MDIGDTSGSAAEAAAKYKPLSLLLVEYKSGELIGFIMAWISMIPIFYAVSLITLIVVRRDLTTIFYFIGFLLTELSNFILKNLLKQPRPISERERHSVGSFAKYGMPSDHSQIMFYCSTFFILLITFRHSVNNNKVKQIAFKGILVVGSFISAFLVAYSRVYLEYHTFQQVFVGGLLGILLGSLWFFAVHTIFSTYFHFITTWYLMFIPIDYYDKSKFLTTYLKKENNIQLRGTRPM